MLIDESLYWWSKVEPIEVSLSESLFLFEDIFKVYRIEGDGEISIYEDDKMSNLIYCGTLPFEPEIPLAFNSVFFLSKNQLMDVILIGEQGKEKNSLKEFLNTTENMEFISDNYNDDSIFMIDGMREFMFNGIEVSNLYISSNHFIGFGINSEQLKILRRDGCSTAIYGQTGETTNGIKFLKIRFEGYTVYNSKIDSNRLIFELFLLSNNDMFLNMVQTPTSYNTGTSSLICNDITIPLTLFDGDGGGCMVSFYNQDGKGYDWEIAYEMYDNFVNESYAYLISENSTFYTISNGILEKIEISNLTSAMFLKYGFFEMPSNEILSRMVNPKIYMWKSTNTNEHLKATIKAYPYPQILKSVVDMRSISIKGIKMMTAEFSGNVGVKFSLNNGESFSEEILLSEWINSDTEELWNSLNEIRILILHFTLYDNASISSFKITYIN